MGDQPSRVSSDSESDSDFQLANEYLEEPAPVETSKTEPQTDQTAPADHKTGQTGPQGVQTDSQGSQGFQTDPQQAEIHPDNTTASVTAPLIPENADQAITPAPLLPTQEETSSPGPNAGPKQETKIPAGSATPPAPPQPEAAGVTKQETEIPGSDTDGGPATPQPQTAALNAVTKQETGIPPGSDTDGGLVIAPAPPQPEGLGPNPVPGKDDIKNEISIVLAGKSGAGKSTLLKNVFGKEEIDTGMSASPKTKDLKTYDVKKNDITINIVDTIGFMEKEKNKQLQDLSAHVSGEADLLLYCLPITQGSRFDDSNPAIMKSLQDKFGKDIWQHCMVVLTFSNLAWDHALQEKTDHNAAIVQYKDYIAEYIDRFRTQLKDLGVPDTQVKVVSVFDENFDPNADTSDTQNIVVVPAGYRPTDEVLQGLQYIFKPSQAWINATNFTNPTVPAATNQQEDPQANNVEWKANLVCLMLKRCRPECSMALLQFWYGRQRIGTALKEQGSVIAGLGGGVAGGATFAAAGGATGAVLGIVGGPIGVPIAAALGVAIGLLVGTLVVGSGAGGITNAAGHVLDKANKTKKKT